MRVLTEIGEVGVEVEGRAYRFRPSFYAMSQLGTPEEVVEAYVHLHGAPRLTGLEMWDNPILRRWARDRIRWALTVCIACAEGDAAQLVGGISERMGFISGAIPVDNVVAIARTLIRHGVVGDVDSRESRLGTKADYSSRFDAKGFAASAMAHLGASEEEAWNMTTTSYLAAMRSKFPPSRDVENAPTPEAYDATMAWLAEVNKIRAARAAEAQAKG